MNVSSIHASHAARSSASADATPRPAASSNGVAQKLLGGLTLGIGIGLTGAGIGMLRGGPLLRSGLALGGIAGIIAGTKLMAGDAFGRRSLQAPAAPSAPGAPDVRIDPHTQALSTSSDGAYSIATYVDESGRPVNRDEAVGMTIVDHGPDGEYLGESFGTLGD